MEEKFIGFCFQFKLIEKIGGEWKVKKEWKVTRVNEIPMRSFAGSVLCAFICASQNTKERLDFFLEIKLKDSKKITIETMED